MEIDVYKEWLGIPEAPRPPDHYELLRLVRFEDDSEKIQKHYKKLNEHVRKYATGKYSTRSQELLNELAKAMLCLTDPERKREYDESLGREFDEEDEERLGRKPLGKLLVDQEHITRDQLKEAEQFAERRGLSLRDAVVQMKLVDQETATRALAGELGLPYVELQDMIPDDSVLDKFPRSLVKRNSILPLFEDDGVLLVACIDSPDPELEDEIRLRFEMPMRGVIATPLAINQGISKYYAPGTRDEKAAAQADAAKSNKSARPKRKKRRSEMTAEEIREQKQIGILIGTWCIIGAVLIDLFFLNTYLPTWMPYLTTLLATPLVIWFVKQNYWS